MSPGAADLKERVETLVGEVIDATGLSLDVAVHEMPDHLRVVLDGEDGHLIVRRRGEALDALQHVINAVFRREVDRGTRLVVDCLDYRRARDTELRQMARFLIARVREKGLPQELGPLNSYSRRLVHLEVADQPDVLSESVGDGALKRVVIRLKRDAAAR